MLSCVCVCACVSVRLCAHTGGCMLPLYRLSAYLLWCTLVVVVWGGKAAGEVPASRSPFLGAPLSSLSCHLAWVCVACHTHRHVHSHTHTA